MHSLSWTLKCRNATLPSAIASRQKTGCQKIAFPLQSSPFPLSLPLPQDCCIWGLESHSTGVWEGKQNKPCPVLLPEMGQRKEEQLRKLQQPQRFKQTRCSSFGSLSPQKAVEFSSHFLVFSRQRVHAEGISGRRRYFAPSLIHDGCCNVHANRSAETWDKFPPSFWKEIHISIPFCSVDYHPIRVILLILIIH